MGKINEFVSLFIVIIILILLTSPPMVTGAAPHAIVGFVYDMDMNELGGATVYINNTRTLESLSRKSDELGRYSVDIDAFPSGYMEGDVLSITAIYFSYENSTTIPVNSEPSQQQDIQLDYRIHLIEGFIFKPDGVPALYFTVKVWNMDKGESSTFLSDSNGYYHVDLGKFINGYSEYDSISVSVDMNGFIGTSFGTVSQNRSDTINVSLTDTYPPNVSIHESPSEVNLYQDFRIIILTIDNHVVSNAVIYIRKSSDIIFSEYQMIQDDGFGNDWNSDGIPTKSLFGQSTLNNLPVQDTLGEIYYYFEVRDFSGNVATLPASNPQNNPYIIKVIDPIMPTISHAPISQLEAGKKVEIIAMADDNIGIDEVRLMYKGVAQSVFTSISMMPTGDPKQYNASIPAQTSIGTLHYYLMCNDTSNNTVRLPTTGEWPVSVADTISPVITHNKINSARLNGAINFTCSVSEILLKSVWLNYTYGAASDNVTMSFDPVGGKWYHRIATLATLDTMYYTIWANDTSGNLAKVSHAFPVLDGDIPFISHESPEHIELGVATDIMAYVEDNAEISFVNLTYLPVGGSSYTVLAMDNTDVPVNAGFGNYSAAIPAQFALGEVRYIINATDGSNNSISWPSLSPYHAVEVSDTVPPVLFDLIYANNTPSGHSARVKINITDVDSIAYARLYYLNSTASQWAVVEMSLNGSQTYECMIPAHAPGRVRFYIASNDSSDNRATLPTITPKLAPYVMNFTDDNPPHLELSIPGIMSVNRTAEAFLNVSDDVSLSSFEIQFSGVNDFLFMPLELFQIGAGSFKCTLPPQMESGTARIFAAASDGNNQNQTQIFNISVVNLLPSIIHTPPGIIPFGSNFSLIAQVTDDLHVENVSLEWKYLDGQSNTIEMRRTNNFYRVNLSFPEPAIINYRIIAHDAESSSAWPESGYRELRISDMEAPVVLHAPITNLTSNQMPIITATVTDNWQVESVTVWHRNSTSDTFLSTSMSPVSGTDDFAVLLGKQAHGNFTYYIEASDGTNTARSPATGYHTVVVEDADGNDSTSKILFIILIMLLLMASILVYLHHRRKSINDAADSGDERVENDENPR